MLRLAPAERVCALVELNNPGVWILGEVRKHIQAAGMGIVIEYANATGHPQWTQPEDLLWNYHQFAAPGSVPVSGDDVHRIPLVFSSKFHGHGRRRAVADQRQVLPRHRAARPHRRPALSPRHEEHQHRRLTPSTFTATPLKFARSIDSPELHGLLKDVVLAPPGLTTEVEFTANDPGLTLFHCHQQDHMDRGFMMVFRYA